MQHLWSLVWSLEAASNERVAATHQIAVRADRSRVRSINVNRHRRDGRPGIGYNVVAIILRRSLGIIPSARQINVLANNAVSGAARRHRHVCPGCVPRIRDRVVFPGRAGFQKVLIKARDDVDLAVGRIIGCASEIAWTRHGSASAPSAGAYIVDLSGGAGREGAVNAAKDINRVGVCGKNRRRIIKGTWNARQRRPRVSNRIILVKLIGRATNRGVKPAHAIPESAVTRTGNGLGDKRVIGHNRPRALCTSGSAGGRGGRRGWAPQPCYGQLVARTPCVVLFVYYHYKGLPAGHINLE